MIPQSLLLVTVATFFAVQTSGQYVDFLQGLQSLFQPYQFDGVTTRRPDSRRHGSRHQNKNPTNPTIVFPDDYRTERPKTTIKPKKNNRPAPSQSPRLKAVQVPRYESTTSSVTVKNNENRKTDYALFSNDNIFFPDDVVITNSNKKNSHWGNKNENRNPTGTSTQYSNSNRNPTITSTQFSNSNWNPTGTSSQLSNSNRNPTVTSTQNSNNNRNPTITSTQFSNSNWNPTGTSSQLSNSNRNPTVTSTQNSNNNRNPTITSTQFNSNRNPTGTSTQFNNTNRNPTVTSTQNSNKNNRNPTTTTQSGNRNPDVTNIQLANQNPVSASLTQWKTNRNPVVASQYGNKNDNRNPDVSNIQLGQGNRSPVSASLTQWSNNDNRNPDVTITKRPTNNRQTGTTRKPLTSRPGVKPAPVDESRPPITNKPIEPVFPVSSNDDEPELEIGPDEDDMSSVQKRQYLAMAEQMCDTYKALNVKKVVALPLVPSPEAVEFNVSDCTPINIPLIIGGTVSNIEEFPHMSLVGWKKVQSAGYSWKCGGSLISDQYVLTAGHCTYHEKDYNVVSGPPHAVQLGSTYVDGPGAVVVKSASVIRHPKYKQRRSYYDVALIKLVSRVKFSDTIKPACLGVPPPVGKPIIATGWGRTEFGGDQSLELRSVSLPIWDMQECKEIWGTSLKLPNGPSSDSHVCAGERAGGKDTCQGDSGGPAQIQEGCIWRVVAVTSSGRSCGAPDTPALYATVPRVFVAAEVFGKKSLDNRYNQINSNNNQPSVNRNTNQNNRVNNHNSQTTQRNQNNYNQPTINNQIRPNVNIQNYNPQTNSQNNWNQNNYEQYQNEFQSNLNKQNRETNQFYQSNNYDQNKNNQINYKEVVTRNPNQYYQNGYESEGWSPDYSRGIYDYNIRNTDYGTTQRPWWSRK